MEREKQRQADRDREMKERDEKRRQEKLIEQNLLMQLNPNESSPKLPAKSKFVCQKNICYTIFFFLLLLLVLSIFHHTHPFPPCQCIRTNKKNQNYLLQNCHQNFFLFCLTSIAPFVIQINNLIHFKNKCTNRSNQSIKFNQ